MTNDPLAASAITPRYSTREIVSDYTGTAVPRKTGSARLGHNPSWVNAVDYDALLAEMERLQSSDRAVHPEDSLQMTDIYGIACDVHIVRTFRDGREMGGGYDLSQPATWFVYDRENAAAKWHKHCGPYSTFEEAKDWINGISDRRELKACANCGGSGSLADMSCCQLCGGGGKVLR